ncbi:MAG: type I 3-dehydroquinate dehydratase, partial [Flavobacteriales bacterium]|nr:type I 3-dehydroquinate dehydratase [Flavobacteriales bacterium]
MKQLNANIIAVIGAKQVSAEDTWNCIPSQVNYIEIQGDQRPIQSHLLPEDSRFKFIYKPPTLREGTNNKNRLKDRNQLLLVASLSFDFVELDAAIDLRPEVLSMIPPHQRLISWKGSDKSLESLEQSINPILKTEAAYYKIVLEQEEPEQAFFPLLLLQKLKCANVICYTDGPNGLWSQILSLHYGSPFIYGMSDDLPHTANHLTISQLIDDYQLPHLHEFNKLYGIVGNSVSRSLSPKMHNNAYRSLSIPALFLPFNVNDFQSFWSEVVCSKHLDQLGFTIEGLTTVSPHKESACIVAKTLSSENTKNTNSCNVLYQNEKHWTGSSTDAYGVFYALEKMGYHIIGTKIAILGCGGAGRSIAYQLKQAGASVTVVNRSLERGMSAAKELQVKFSPLEGFQPSAYTVIINATPLGKNSGEIPFEPSEVPSGGLIIDMAYTQETTEL